MVLVITHLALFCTRKELCGNKGLERNVWEVLITCYKRDDYKFVYISLYSKIVSYVVKCKGADSSAIYL